MKHYLLLIGLFTLTISLISCSPWKDGLIPKGDENAAVANSIIDFLNSSTLSKKDSVFSINVNNLNDDLIGISILGSYNKVLPTPETKIGSPTNTIPTRYVEKNGKLFYWFDSKHILTKDVVSILLKYNIIDSMNVNGIVGIPDNYIDDSKKGVDYYFCRNNILNYKKVTNKIAMGYYNIPKLDCK